MKQNIKQNMNTSTKEFTVNGKKMEVSYTSLTRSVGLQTFTDNDYFETEYKFSTAEEARGFFESFDESKAKTMKLLIDFSLEK
jgi:hypothetical protein